MSERPPDDQVVLLGEERATPSDARWQLRAEELHFAALGTIRAAAERWGDTVAKLVGLLTIVALVKGPDDISQLAGSWKLSGLSLSWKVTVAGLVAICVALALGATVLAALAAQGVPHVFRFTGDELRQWSEADAESATRLLFWSRLSALFIVPLLTTAIGITWLRSPTSERPGSKVVIFLASGDAECGTLQGFTGRRVAILDGGEGHTVSFSLRDVESITSVSSCGTDG